MKTCPTQYPSHGISSQTLDMRASDRSALSTFTVAWPSVKIGTWKIRGGNCSDKRDSIDDYLSLNRFGIVALQETKLAYRTCDTRHYKWVLGMSNGCPRDARRLAFLIHLSCLRLVRKTYDVSENILAIEVCEGSDITLIVNVHMPQHTGYQSDFDSLRSFLMSHHHITTIVLGDFNAHVGKLDLTARDRQFIGPNLYHDRCNDNGEELKNMMHLGCFSVKNSWSQSPSVLVTWTNSRVSSQIDHMLCNSPLTRFRQIFGTWVKSVMTDHKLLSAVVTFPSAMTYTRKRISFTAPIERHELLNTRWDVAGLDDVVSAKRYREDMAIGSRVLLDLEGDAIDSHSRTPCDLWGKVSKLMTQIAVSTLPLRPVQLTPERAKADEVYKDERAKLARRPNDVLLQDRVRLAKQCKERLGQLHIDGECRRFFNNLQSVHPRRRIAMTYKYVRRFRRKKSRSVSKRITISQWDLDLRKSCVGTPPANILEDDYIPMGPPPTITDIEAIIQRMRNGTAPGQDHIPPELFKFGPPELFEIVRVLLSRAWCTNVIPDSWLHTTQVPLPKKSVPNSIDDFRRITLSNAIYKIYASYLLGQLERYIGDIFTLRRISEERWRKGLPTYVMSIDLRKAFDRLILTKWVKSSRDTVSRRT